MVKKKTKEVAETTNENKELTTNDLVEEIIEGVLSEKNPGDDSKRVRFFCSYLLGVPTGTAAKMAGYSKNYAYQLISKFKRDPDLRKKIQEFINLVPERFEALSKLRLIKIAEIEDKALNTYQNQPELAIKHPGLLKSMKGTAGIGSDDNRPQPMINVQNLQNFMLQISNQRRIDLQKEEEGR